MDNQTQPTKAVKPRIHSKAEVKALAQAEAKKSKAADLVKIVIALLVVAAAVWAFLCFTATECLRAWVNYHCWCGHCLGDSVFCNDSG